MTIKPMAKPVINKITFEANCKNCGGVGIDKINCCAYCGTPKTNHTC